MVDGNLGGRLGHPGRKGKLEGNVSARGVILGRQNRGKCCRQEILEIKSKGKVTEISVLLSSRCPKGVFLGRSTMTGDSKVVELPVRKSWIEPGSCSGG